MKTYDSANDDEVGTTTRFSPVSLELSYCLSRDIVISLGEIYGNFPSSVYIEIYILCCMLESVDNIMLSQKTLCCLSKNNIVAADALEMSAFETIPYGCGRILTCIWRHVRPRSFVHNDCVHCVSRIRVTQVACTVIKWTRSAARTKKVDSHINQVLSLCLPNLYNQRRTEKVVDILLKNETRQPWHVTVIWWN